MRDPTSGFPLAPDESKRREWEEIVRLLSVRKGRISEEGIERLAKSLGMGVWKDGSSSKGGTTTLSLSKDTVVIDMTFRDNEVIKVTVEFANTTGAMVELAGQAGRVLLGDLTSQGKTPGERINSSLGTLAGNLDRLALLDRLSSKAKLNLFTALGGMYENLRKVYEMQVGVRDEKFAVCEGMGKPSMHAGGVVGLSIEYWKERFDISRKRTASKPTTTASSSSEAMDVDDAATADEEVYPPPNQKSYRAIILAQEVQPEYASPIPFVRNSTAWLTPDATLTNPEEIPWYEPENPVIEPGAAVLTYSARLEPPVFVADGEENAVFYASGGIGPQGATSTLDKELFGSDIFSFDDIVCERRMWTPDGEKSQTWRFKKMRVPYVKEVSEVPMGHPRELGEVFAILRQHIFFQTLLSSVLNPAFVEAAKTTTDASSLPPYELSVSNFPHTITVILPPSPVPSSSDTAAPATPQLVTLQIEVLRNAKCTVHIETGAYSADGPRRVDSGVEDKIKRILEETCDLGVAVEVVRKLVG